jgi:DNA-binding MarR family transcriptional regulator
MENKKNCKRPVTPPMLVNEISRLFHARMKSVELEGVMSQDSARLIMRELMREDGVSQLHLTRMTHLKPPTVSVTLRRMEEEGLVRREADSNDRRAVRVLLTEQGKTHNRRVFARLRELDALLMEGFDETEAETLKLLLMRMRENILPEEKEKNTQE